MSTSPRFLPVALDLRGATCVIVGGGPIGTRKARSLARAGAEVTVVSPDVSDDLAAEIEGGAIRWLAEPFRKEQVEGSFLVVAATGDEDLNEAVARAAAERGALVCDASSAERSTLIFGAMLETDGLTIAVFSDGLDPARSRQTRDRIADWLVQKRPSQSEP